MRPDSVQIVGEPENAVEVEVINMARAPPCPSRFQPFDQNLLQARMTGMDCSIFVDAMRRFRPKIAIMAERSGASSTGTRGIFVKAAPKWSSSVTRWISSS